MSINSCEERLILDKAPNKKQDLAEWQGITITFSASLERYTYREQYNKTAYQLCRLFTEGSTCYRICPEFTESGRIHYHGVYKPSTKYKTLKMYEKLRKTGYIKIERKVSHNWHEYIIKDYKDTSKLIGLSNITVDNDMHTRMEAIDKQRRLTIEQFVKVTSNEPL